MTRKRVAIVGLDHYHTTGWVESLELFDDQLEIVAFYEPDTSLQPTFAPRFFDPHLSPSLGERYKSLPWVTTLDALITDHAPDLALVTLPNRDAPAAIAQLSNAGVHMLVDKPAALNADAAAGWLAVARDNNTKVATGLLRRYSRGWQAAREMMAEGRAGKLFSTESVFNTSSPLVRNPANHIFSRELQGGGILMWLGIHDIDQLLWQTGERIVEVQAMSGQVTDSGIGVEDIMSASLRYESGAIGSVHYAYVLPRTLSEGYVAFRGERGSMTIQTNGTVKWVGPGNSADPILEETIATTHASMPGYGSMAPLVIADLLRSIEEDRDPLANGEDLVKALRVIDALYESASSGKRVSISW